MTTADMENPAAGLAVAPRPEPFRLTILVPMYNEQDTAGPFFDATVEYASGMDTDASGDP